MNLILIKPLNKSTTFYDGSNILLSQMWNFMCISNAITKMMYGKWETRNKISTLKNVILLSFYGLISCGLAYDSVALIYIVRFRFCSPLLLKHLSFRWSNLYERWESNVRRIPQTNFNRHTFQWTSSFSFFVVVYYCVEFGFARPF